jgi:hypothetical protein
MLADLFKCFLAGFAGFASIALIGWLTWFAWPWSGYVWGGLLFIVVCVGFGADLLNPCPRMPPR